MLEAELIERDGWTRYDLLAYQTERVRALITHAVSRSPYYQDVLGADAAERLPACCQSERQGKVVTNEVHRRLRRILDFSFNSGT